MNRIAYVGLSAVLSATLIGCVSYTRNHYQSACERQGVSAGTAAMASCIEGYIATRKAEALDVIGAGLLVGAIANGNAQSQSTSVNAAKLAPLLSYTVNGWQRICKYQTDVRIVQTVIASSTSCPASYQY